MSSIVNMPLPKLVRKADKLEKELLEREPIRMREYVLLQEAIQQKRSHPNVGPFTSIRSPQKAVLLCLSLAGKTLTREQVIDELIEGGFAIDKESKKWIMNTTMAAMAKDGKIINHGPEEGMRTIIGLPSES